MSDVNIYYQKHHLNTLPANLACPCCGEFNQNPQFALLMRKLETVKNRLSYSLDLTSAYRCALHPIESSKSKPGPHSIAAVHISVNRSKAFELVMEALRIGINGIGINQCGPLAQRYIHLDLREKRRVWLGSS